MKMHLDMLDSKPMFTGKSHCVIKATSEQNSGKAHCKSHKKYRKQAQS